VATLRTKNIHKKKNSRDEVHEQKKILVAIFTGKKRGADICF